MYEEHEVVKTTEVTTSIPENVVAEPPQKVFEKKKTIFRSHQTIWYIVSVIEVLLAFRVFLKILAADPTSGFGHFVYVVSDPFALPFSRVVGVAQPPISGGAYVEWSTFIGMAVYWIVAFGIVQLLQFVKPVSPKEVERSIDH